MARDLGFTFADEVKALGVTGDFFVMEGIDNTQTSPELEAYKREVFERLRRQYSEEFIAGDPVLTGFRRLHDKVRRFNKKHIASPENLIRLLLARGELPSINPIVDIYNCVSLESRLAIGAHDIDKVTGNVALRMTDGSEGFLPIGAATPKKVEAGEYGYIDDAPDIICRLECRQVEKTKVTPGTRDAFLIVQGNENTPPSVIHEVREKLIALIKRFCGGSEKLLYVSS